MSANKPVTFGFSDATTLGRDGFSRCESPIEILTRAESLARLVAWVTARPARDRLLVQVLSGEVTGSAAGQILGVNNSTITRWCRTLLFAARRDLMEKTS